MRHQVRCSSMAIRRRTGGSRSYSGLNRWQWHSRGLIMPAIACDSMSCRAGAAGRRLTRRPRIGPVTGCTCLTPCLTRAAPAYPLFVPDAHAPAVAYAQADQATHANKAFRATSAPATASSASSVIMCHSCHQIASNRSVLHATAMTVLIRVMTQLDIAVTLAGRKNPRVLPRMTVMTLRLPTDKRLAECRPPHGKSAADPRFSPH